MNSIRGRVSIKARNALRKKHNSLPLAFCSILISTILNNDKSRFVSSFKDHLIYDDDNEFLKRYYRLNEAIRKLRSFFEFYKLNSKIFPNYVTLFESKYLFKNIKRKQKMLDNLREIEENQNESLVTQSEILFYNALGSLCSMGRIDDDEPVEIKGEEGTGGKDDNNESQSEICVYKLIDEINKYDWEDNRDDLIRRHNDKKTKNNNNCKNHYVNYYKKYLKDYYNKTKVTTMTKTKTDKKNKNNHKNSKNNDNKTQRNISPVSKVTQSNNNKVSVISNNNTHNSIAIKKEESKVVLVVKNDIKATDKRISSTSYPKRSKQNKMIVVLPSTKENKTSVINNKYAQKIDVSSVNDCKPTSNQSNNAFSNSTKYFKAALTERNAKLISTANVNANPSANSKNHPNKDKITKLESKSNCMTLNNNTMHQLMINKIKKTEAKSIPKETIKESLSLFSQENSLIKSSINPQLTKSRIETKSKPIIILKDNSSKGSNVSNGHCRINKLEHSAIIDPSLSITQPLNNQYQLIKEKKKYTPFTNSIPNLHINFNSRCRFISKSKEKGKASGNMNVNGSVKANGKSKLQKSNINNATNNTTHTINESINNINNKDSIGKKQTMYTQLQLQKQNKNSNCDNKETHSLQVNNPQTGRLTNINNRVTELNSSLNLDAKVFKSNDKGMMMKMMIYDNESITALAQKLSHFKSSNSSINNSNNNSNSNSNNNRTVLNDTARINGQLTTRTEHSNPHSSNINNKKKNSTMTNPQILPGQVRMLTKGTSGLNKQLQTKGGVIKEIIDLKHNQRRLNYKTKTVNI